MYSLGQVFDAHSEDMTDPSGKTIRVITSGAVRDVARILGTSPREAEISSLEAGIWPMRYERNRGTLGSGGQLRLLRSHAAVVGLGGLGGLAAELLVRAGIGKITVFDPDCYDETNLNRQLHSLADNLGESKRASTSARLRDIDPHVDVREYGEVAGLQDGTDKMAGVDIVLDCLDSVSDRLLLVEICRFLQVPMIHGAIAGYSGQIAVVHPGDRILEILYDSGGDTEQGIEVSTGNLGPTAATVASIQVSEAIKVLTGTGHLASGGVLLVDLYRGQFEKVPLA